MKLNRAMEFQAETATIPSDLPVQFNRHTRKYSLNGYSVSLIILEHTDTYKVVSGRAHARVLAKLLP